MKLVIRRSIHLRGDSYKWMLIVRFHAWLSKGTNLESISGKTYESIKKSYSQQASSLRVQTNLQAQWKRQSH